MSSTMAAVEASLSLPFSRDQFFDVFAQYNDTIWPGQLALFGVGVACVVASFAHLRWARLIPWALAGLWAWMGIAYHFFFFTRINPAAWLFGAVFLVGAGLFAVHAKNSTLSFGASTSRRRWAGLALVLYALVVYPMIGALEGHAYPRSPTFGLPCPTTIFTLGMLLMASSPVARTLFIVPMLWSVVGTFAAINLGVTQDYGLPVAALVTTLSLVGNALSVHRPRNASR